MSSWKAACHSSTSFVKYPATNNLYLRGAHSGFFSPQRGGGGGNSIIKMVNELTLSKEAIFKNIRKMKTVFGKLFYSLPPSFAPPPPAHTSAPVWLPLNWIELSISYCLLVINSLASPSPLPYHGGGGDGEHVDFPTSSGMGPPPFSP